MNQYLIDLAFKYRKHAIRATEAAIQQPKPRKTGRRCLATTMNCKNAAEFYDKAADLVTALNRQ